MHLGLGAVARGTGPAGCTPKDAPHGMPCRDGRSRRRRSPALRIDRDRQATGGKGRGTETGAQVPACLAVEESQQEAGASVSVRAEKLGAFKNSLSVNHEMNLLSLVNS